MDLGITGCSEIVVGVAELTGTGWAVEVAGLTVVAGVVAGSLGSDFAGVACGGVVTICDAGGTGEVPASSRAQAKAGNSISTNQLQKRNNLAIIFKYLRAAY